MHFEQIYLACLAQASYLVGDGGLCAVVDPRRDVEVYLEAAARAGLRIAHVIETHLHADFVSGHVELAARTGATIHIGHAAGATFAHRAAREGDEIVMGQVVLRFLETPGHTPESVCVLVFDRAVASDRPLKVLTGDTLFVGDVGRPDLVAARGRTAAQMAGLLHDSLHGKLLALPDAVEVWPAHGAGSACGKNIGKELSSTIGDQRRLNWALQPMRKEAFVEALVAGLAPAPAYFGHDAELNRRGAPPLAELPAPAALEAEAFARAAAGATVLDVRAKAAWGAAHVPGSINIGLGGSFASWCGALLPLDRPLLLVAEDRAGVDEAVMRLARVGLHDVAGWLRGGVEAWRAAGRAVGTVAQLDPPGLAAARAADAGGELLVLDVRGPGEYADRHVPGAVNVPLPQLAARLGELDPRRPTAVICASGYRSNAACGLLARAGFRRVSNVDGGTNGWVAAGLETESSGIATKA